MRISNQTRISLIAVAVIVLLVGGELALEWWSGAETVVLVENLGTSPIEDFVLTFGESKSAIPPIAAGDSVKLFVKGSGSHPLSFKFQQVGNPLNSIELPEFSPDQLERDGMMLNIRFRPNGEIERFGDQNTNSGTPLLRRYRQFKTWLSELFISPR